MVGVITRVLVCATPLPEMLMTAGLPGALCVMVIVAVRVPEAVGRKPTVTVQVLPVGPCDRVLGASGHPFETVKSPGFVPPGVTELMVTGEVPVLVTSTL